MRITRAVFILAGMVLAGAAVARDQLPIFDVHLHADRADAQGPPPLAMCTPISMPAWDAAEPYADTFMRALKNPGCPDPVWSPLTDDEVRDRTIAAMERHNVVGVLSGSPERVAQWRAAAPGRFYAGLGFNVAVSEMTPEDIRKLHAEGRLDAIAEVTNQYSGVPPNDPRMESYWSVAEELDIPVGIHIGPGPPGVIYLGSENYRARLHSPLMLEEVLVRHPKLRVYVMHAGFPMLDDTLALLYAHPQVYVGVGVIVYTQPREAFYRYLEALVDAGFGKRILFGSDQMVWPETIERSIDVIEQAPFLSPAQKRDILYDNAARFFRLSDDTIDRHKSLATQTGR
ncbi:MAG: amidohydrolase family protein [Woeseiaceae bacterium]|nr:amidohydrolase family protein [Woeseiaceae bacterium]